MITVEMELPDEMMLFAMPENKEDQIVRNAMMLYPYIQKRKSNITNEQTGNVDIGRYCITLISREEFIID